MVLKDPSQVPILFDVAVNIGHIDGSEALRPLALRFQPGDDGAASIAIQRGSLVSFSRRTTDCLETFSLSANCACVSPARSLNFLIEFTM